MNRIELYLGRVVVSHTLVVMMVLLIILIFGEFMMQLGRLQGDYDLMVALGYSLLKIPVFGYEAFPMALLIGTLIGLGGLANHAELTVLRVTGWPIWRIFLAVVKSALLLWLVVAILGEFLAPRAEALAIKWRAEALQQNISLGDRSGFWMKDGERFIHVQTLLSADEMHNITVYELVEGELKQIMRSPQARYDDGRWVLSSVDQLALNFVPLAESQYSELKHLVLTHTHLNVFSQSFPVDPDLIERLRIEARYMGVVDLYAYIRFLHANNLEAAHFQLELWRKIASPLVVLGMLALVFPLIFGSQRQVSMGQRIFIGILIGMGFHLLNQIFGNVSVVYHLPPMFGALLPSLFLLVMASLLFKRLR